MEKKTRKKSLGRGLSTLLAETNSDDATGELISSFDVYLPIEKIKLLEDGKQASFRKI